MLIAPLLSEGASSSWILEDAFALSLDLLALPRLDAVNLFMTLVSLLRSNQANAQH